MTEIVEFGLLRLGFRHFGLWRCAFTNSIYPDTLTIDYVEGRFFRRVGSAACVRSCSHTPIEGFDAGRNFLLHLRKPLKMVMVKEPLSVAGRQIAEY